MNSFSLLESPASYSAQFLLILHDCLCLDYNCLCFHCHQFARFLLFVPVSCFRSESKLDNCCLSRQTHKRTWSKRRRRRSTTREKGGKDSFPGSAVNAFFLSLPWFSRHEELRQRWQWRRWWWWRRWSPLSSSSEWNAFFSCSRKWHEVKWRWDEKTYCSLSSTVSPYVLRNLCLFFLWLCIFLGSFFPVIHSSFSWCSSCLFILLSSPSVSLKILDVLLSLMSSLPIPSPPSPPLSLFLSHSFCITSRFHPRPSLYLLFPCPLYSPYFAFYSLCFPSFLHLFHAAYLFFSHSFLWWTSCTIVSLVFCSVEWVAFSLVLSLMSCRTHT